MNLEEFDLYKNYTREDIKWKENYMRLMCNMQGVITPKKLIETF